jgi:hypothetical protein
MRMSGKGWGADVILPGTGRGTATRSGVVEGARPSMLRLEDSPLHHPAGGPPPRFGEEQMAASTHYTSFRVAQIAFTAPKCALALWT